MHECNVCTQTAVNHLSLVNNVSLQATGLSTLEFMSPWAVQGGTVATENTVTMETSTGGGVVIGPQPWWRVESLHFMVQYINAIRDMYSIL